MFSWNVGKVVSVFMTVKVMDWGQRRSLDMCVNGYGLSYEQYE